MKKHPGIRMAVFFSLVLFVSYTTQNSAFGAGPARPKDILKLFPKDVKAIFFIDFHKAMTSDFVDSVLKQEREYERYQEFIDITGMDPKKDIFYIAGGITETQGKGKQKGFAIINLKYDKQTLFDRLKEKMEAEVGDKDSSGLTFFMVESHGERFVGAFLDKSNIVVGTEDAVKAVIDVYQKKDENFYKNKQLSGLIKYTNTRAMIWGATLFPSDIMEQFEERSALFKNIQTFEAATFSVDYRKKNLLSEAKIISSDQKTNQQIMDFLQGIKAFAALAAPDKPEVEELLNSVEITSGADFIQVYAKFPTELIEKIKKLRNRGNSD